MVLICLICITPCSATNPIFLPRTSECAVCLQLESQCEQLQLKVKTLQLDWETDQKRCTSYFNQVMELEKERDQVSLQSLYSFHPAFNCFFTMQTSPPHFGFHILFDQALRGRDSLQLEYTDCLLDKSRLRKRIAELQVNLEQQQRDLERERERNQEQRGQSNHCLHCVS